MTQELKPCPFCWNLPFLHECEELLNEKGELEVICLCNDCPIAGIGISFKAWQTKADTAQCDILGRALKGVNKAHDRALERVEALEKALGVARDALLFYRKMENYMAEMNDDKPGFNFKETPIHNDGGARAFEAVRQIDALIQEGGNVSNRG